MPEPVIYLASPYSHDNPAIREERYQLALIACARLIGLGAVVYSPIAHSHVIAQTGAIPGDWQTWEKQCMALLDKCDVLLVLTLPGWMDSVGIKAEVTHFLPTGKLVIYADLNSLNHFHWNDYKAILQGMDPTAQTAD